MKRNSVIYEDISFHLFWWFPEKYDHFIEFEAFEIVGIGKDFYLYELKAGGCTIPSTKDVDEAQPYLHGEIKWDGCSNWYFDIQDEVMLHFCDIEDFENINELFRRMYKIAKDNIIR